MPLTGEQFGDLVAATCEALDWSALEHLVRIRFNVVLEVEVAGSETAFKTVAAKWVDWLEQRGRTADFIGYLWAERKGNDRVRRFYEAYTAAAPPVGPAGPAAPAPAVPGPARDAVIEFKLYFRESEVQFRYLNAYKDLHEKLHVLHEMSDGIDKAVDRFRRRPDDKMELEVIAEELQALAREAHESATALEDPADAPWLEALAEASDGLAAAARAAGAADLGRLDRCVNILHELPDQHQAGLDAELLKTAKRLRSDRLAKTAADALTRFGDTGPAAPPLLSEFRARLGGFSGLCDRLTQQIERHNACQRVELTLAPFAATATVSPDRIPGWGWAAAELANLATARPDDPRARQTAAAAATFGAAAGPQAADLFAGLLIRFRKLFHEADKELLEATDDLVREARLLSVQLRTLTNVPD
jgi:hypothetical protein